MIVALQTLIYAIIDNNIEFYDEQKNFKKTIFTKT